jgi:hypothetical protein
VIGAAAAWTAALRDWDGGQLQQAATSRNSGEAGAPAVHIPGNRNIKAVSAHGIARCVAM